ncbi:hypothetical protein GGQ85_000407 [Nitrobacter vulgaris]|uniref:hypothetical protein n=1 Tax=Nitrobacter vulgaris TaxID=29421 RepID=UPI002866E278|nr:hypothetical protein [Nitrobacter vulgaris]MDR6302731.1 hypothetical protein [Nitrobacter vulgaris]
MARMEDGHIVETAMEARGAERGPTVRNVLVAGTALVIAAFVLVYILYFGGGK